MTTKNENKTMHIAVCLDDTYFAPAFLLVNSIIETNKDEKLYFHVIFSSLRDEYVRQFKTLASDSVYVAFHQISEESLKHCPIRPQDHVSLATYFRILLPVILPDDVRKVLYVDSDMLCLDRITNMYEEDLTGFSMAASFDCQCENPARKAHLGLDTDSKYFAAGVLLVNLEYWRANKVHIRTLDYIAENTDLCVWHDQDALNAVLKGTIKRLDFKYNFYELYFKVKSKSTLSDNLWAEALRDRRNICLLHYSQAEKPWHYECEHPLRNLWRAYHKKILGREGKKLRLKFKYRGRRRLSYIKRKILRTVFHFTINENYEIHEGDAMLDSYFEKLGVPRNLLLRPIRCHKKEN